MASVDPAPVDERSTLDQRFVLHAATVRKVVKFPELKRQNVALPRDEGGVDHCGPRVVGTGQAVDPGVEIPPVEAWEARDLSEYVVEAVPIGDPTDGNDNDRHVLMIVTA